MLPNTGKYGKLFLHKVFYRNKRSVSDDSGCVCYCDLHD